MWGLLKKKTRGLKVAMRTGAIGYCRFIWRQKDKHFKWEHPSNAIPPDGFEPMTTMQPHRCLAVVPFRNDSAHQNSDTYIHVAYMVVCDATFKRTGKSSTLIKPRIFRMIKCDWMKHTRMSERRMIHACVVEIFDTLQRFGFKLVHGQK